jgi:quinolinate synthase
MTGEQLRELKRKHPGALVVCYVNSSAEVKAESDYCCTSANAVEVVESLPKDSKIIFVPDQHLGRFVIEKTGRDMVLWPGYCPTHAFITEDDVKKAREAHPGAIVMAHPECTEPVKAVSDKLLSTGQMLKFAKQSDAKSFIIATETGIIHSLKKENPDKEFYPVTTRALCPNMKRITLDKVLWSLEDMHYKITVPADIAARAKNALEKMVAVLPAK